MKKPLTLIKLGGSVITHKEVPMMLRTDVLQNLVQEIADAQKETGETYIIGHGQGSFAHAPAMRYKTMDGFVSEDSQIGMAITQDSAAQLNRIVVKEFLSQEFPAVSFYFSNSMVTDSQKPLHWCGQVFEEYLEKGLFPITGGDVLVDKTNGCTIWSTEKVLGYLAEYFLDHSKYTVKKIIHVGEVPGVLDNQGAVISKITPQNIFDVQKMIGATKGFDVTGGMGHKLEESMKLVEQGMEVIILSGLEKGRLYSALTEKDFVGTKMSTE